MHMNLGSLIWVTSHRKRGDTFFCNHNMINQLCDAYVDPVESRNAGKASSGKQFHINDNCGKSQTKLVN